MGRTGKQKELSPIRAVYAGASERRLAALQQVRGLKVDSYGGGEEPDIDNVLAIAIGKMDHIYPSVIASNGGGDYRKTYMVAADARTEIYKAKEKSRKNKSTFESKGKPKQPGEVFSHFQAMSAQAEKDGKGLYRVVAASAVQTVIPDIPERINSLGQTQSCEVHLNTKVLKHLGTPDGFHEYSEAFREFYDSPLYRGEGFTPPTLRDLSGGISLPVLLRMGAVEQIGNQRMDRKKIEGLFNGVRKALLLVAVGFGPRVLREIDPSAYDQILEWHWLNEVTKAALDMD